MKIAKFIERLSRKNKGLSTLDRLKTDKAEKMTDEQKSADFIPDDSINKNSAVKWYYQSIEPSTLGIALVIHGLNLNPVRMSRIVNLLNNLGIDVCLLSLRGHGDNFLKNGGRNPMRSRMRSFSSVTYAIWKSEVEFAYNEVIRHSEDLQVPFYFVGYSLGGLLGCDLLSRKKKKIFQKMVLFAPALTPHRVRVPFLRLLFLFPKLIIPSLSPKFYRANWGTPIAAYLSLLEAVRNFKQNISCRLNIPTVVFLDRNDELVSYSKLKRFIKKHKLNLWKIHKIKRNPEQLKFPYYHLIIDENSAGQKDWKAIVEKTIHHLAAMNGY